MTFQKGQGRIGGSVKGQKYQTSSGYNGVQKWAKKHGLVENRDWRNGRIGCKCGRQFDSEKGLYVHVGKMGKLSNKVAEYLPSNPNQGSY